MNTRRHHTNEHAHTRTHTSTTTEELSVLVALKSRKSFATNSVSSSSNVTSDAHVSSSASNRASLEATLIACYGTQISHGVKRSRMSKATITPGRSKMPLLPSVTCLPSLPFLGWGGTGRSTKEGWKEGRKERTNAPSLHSKLRLSPPRPSRDDIRLPALYLPFFLLFFGPSFLPFALLDLCLPLLPLSLPLYLSSCRPSVLPAVLSSCLPWRVVQVKQLKIRKNLFAHVMLVV